MINGDKRDQEVKRTLDLLERIDRVSPSPFLADRVMRRLEERQQVPARMMTRTVCYALAGLIALAALNALTVIRSGTRVERRDTDQTGAVDSLAVEYGLTTQEYRYWE
jgi:protein-disulfide isomerase-like protein with CxxC motif